jgi:hypothetical protein
MPGCRRLRSVVDSAQKAVEFGCLGRLHSVFIDLGCRGMEGEVGGNSYSSRRRGATRRATSGSGKPRSEILGARAPISRDAPVGRVQHT